MRHLPLSKWGVRAESRSRHSPLGHGGTRLPHRQTGVLGGRVGVTHFAVKAILLVRVARAPQPPEPGWVAAPGCSARSRWATEPAGGGAHQPRAVLAVGPGSFAGAKERGGRRMHYAGGCGTDAGQPTLLQPSAAFGARREGPELAKRDAAGPAGTAWGTATSGSVQGTWLLSGSLGGGETGRAERLAPRSLPPPAKQAGREDPSVIPFWAVGPKPRAAGRREGTQLTNALPTLCPVPDKPYTSPAPGCHPGSVPPCPLAPRGTLARSASGREPSGLPSSAGFKACSSSIPPKFACKLALHLWARWRRERAHRELARGTIFPKERESRCSSSHRHRLHLFSRPRDH